MIIALVWLNSLIVTAFYQNQDFCPVHEKLHSFFNGGS